MANEQRMQRPLFTAVLVLLLAAGGITYWMWSSAQPAANGSLTASGSVEQTEYQIAPAMAGRIETITVGEGDRVKADAVIVRLDRRALELQLTQALAGVDAANAAVTQAKHDGTKAEVNAAQARVAQAKAAVQLAEVQLSYATVITPHAGVVSAVAGNAGQNASPGKTIVTISDTNDLFVRVFVAETRIGDVKRGSGATVKTDSSDVTYPGTVEFIASEAEFTPNNVETKDQRVKLVYEVRVRLSDTSGVLKAGMPVDVTF
ncbi:MAG: efflux RND transporter periplasmic adaptor subunit [Coriobacteriia bacterium]|nr:efflux RND transporter periplasmic adaptor subunit [Coriobacteriia bacterium]